MTLFVDKYGLKEATIKFLKIIGWYVASGAITGAGAYIAGFNVVDEKNGILIGVLMVVNALLAGASKWLTTNKPELVEEYKG